MLFCSNSAIFFFLVTPRPTAPFWISLEPTSDANGFSLRYLCKFVSFGVAFLFFRVYACNIRILS